jgi:1,4-alpha-glucan branching enzyme
VIGGIKKQYLKHSILCNITFILPKEAAPGAQTVTIVGDFNNWNLTDTQMKKLRNGDFKVTLNLPREREYRFRYLIDGSRWENDWNADKYVPNQHGCDDSLVIV